MKIYLKQLSEQETELNFTQQEAWVRSAVERVDEKLENEVPRPQQGIRPIEVEFSISKVDDVVVLNGHIDTYIELVCSRCAALFHFKTRPHFSALFVKIPQWQGSDTWNLRGPVPKKAF